MKRLFIVLAAVAFGASTAFAGSVTVLYTGAEATAILAPGLYDITAYGAQGVGDAGGVGTGVSCRSGSWNSGDSWSFWRRRRPVKVSVVMGRAR